MQQSDNTQQNYNDDNRPEDMGVNNNDSNNAGGGIAPTSGEDWDDETLGSDITEDQSDRSANYDDDDDDDLTDDEDEVEDDDDDLTDDEDDQDDPARETDGSGMRLESEGTGFAKPQADDWPNEDESRDNPGGPTI